METLEKADFRGSKIIHENLGKLKTHLEAEAPDGAAIGQLLQSRSEKRRRAPQATMPKMPRAKRSFNWRELLSSAGGGLSK